MIDVKLIFPDLLLRLTYLFESKSFLARRTNILCSLFLVFFCKFLFVNFLRRQAKQTFAVYVIVSQPECAGE